MIHLDPLAIGHLCELANMASNLVEGAPDQVDAQDAFFDVVAAHLTPEQQIELDVCAHHATVDERVQYALELLGLHDAYADHMMGF